MIGPLEDEGRRIAEYERHYVLRRVNRMIRRGELEDAARLAERAGMLAVAERVRGLRAERTG